MLTLRKLESDASRTSDLCKARERSIKKRREAAIAAKRQRDYVKLCDGKDTRYEKLVTRCKPSAAYNVIRITKKKGKLKSRKKQNKSRKGNPQTTSGGYNSSTSGIGEEQRILHDLRVPMVRIALSFPTPFVSPYETSQQQKERSVKAIAVPAFATVRSDGTLTF